MARPVRLAVLLLALASQASHASPLRELIELPGAAQPSAASPAPPRPAKAPVPAQGVRDVAYGDHGLQRFDVYLPQHAAGPVIFMVHGGAWRYGDKALRDVVVNKAGHWLAQGYVFISVNNRLLPTDPLEQAKDVARALALAQQQAPSWGGDPRRFILMGHSAGAHLVGLVSASPALARQAGALPWLGTVSLDTAALDVVEIMTSRHPRLYDHAFGSDPVYWRSVSPLHVLSQAGPPVLAVCSTRRSQACPAARRFAAKANGLGQRTTVLEQDLSHSDINQQLGTPGDYTDSVDRWISSIL